MKVVFMGTPLFAVESLKAIHESEIEVVGVVTAPDRPAGRGQKVKMSDVKQYALEADIPVLQPEKLKSEEFIDQLKSLEADLFVVVAFRMLPEIVWQMPAKGTINLHGSILPNYRGAAPIHWAVINGDQQTGVSTFFIEKEIDTGAVIDQKTMSIGPNDTTGDVHDGMMVMGAQVLLETCRKIAADQASGTPQNQLPEATSPKAPKLFKSDCLIQWDQSAHQIHNFVRGLNPYPTAWTMWGDKSVKIHKTELTDLKSNGDSGSWLVDKNELFIHCDEGVIRILELQVQGKKRVSTSDFLNGLRDINVNSESFHS
ncbi:MAG: methionyl-tRNA formyltransferase [Flavobacteriales bacterium]|nr:methionyl-tRNA formyltransferase [Flavobacteriales bacterium]